MIEKETILEDWSIVAYLSLKGLKITPIRKPNGRIAFLINGDVESAISDIYANKKVGINDYIKALKSVRNAIFTLRSLKNTHEGEESNG
jgi:hypothetical protein